MPGSASRWRASLVLAATASLAGGGCAANGAAAARPIVVTVATPGAGVGAGAGVGLDEAETSAFAQIAATDPRFAKRLAEPPTENELRAAAVKALAEGDADVSIRDGALDFFSFTARARALSAATKALERSPETPAGAAGAAAASRLERELTVRLLAEERARLEEERALPRGASALVRGIGDTWSAPGSPEAMAQRDVWLAARLDEIRDSLSGSTLPRGPLLELDDSLDPLERIAPPDQLPSAAQAMARLRVALEATPSAPGSADDGRRARLEASVRAHLGLAFDAKEIRARLEKAEAVTRALAKKAVGNADERLVARRAEELTLAPGKCDASLFESRVRSMAPPSERAAICGSLRTLRDATDATARAAALVALHDAAVVALWALAIHADGALPERAIASAHPFFGAQPDREARLVRFAETNPVAAIGAGLAAELLFRNAGVADDAGSAGGPSLDQTNALGRRWLSFGDAPLDVVERELLVSGPTSPGRPASPRP